MSLTSKLKDEHRVMTEAAGELAQIIPSTSPQTLSTKLAAIKTSLVEHLGKEDAELYPAVIHAAEKANDQVSRQTVESFAATMKPITSTVVKFFDKYESPGAVEQADRQVLLKEWNDIVSAFQRRIMSEEAGLYRIYERLVG